MELYRRLVGLGIVVLVLLWAMAEGGGLMKFVDIPGAIMVVGLLVGGLWFCFGPMAVLRAVAVACTGVGDREKAASVFNLAHQLAWGVGIVATICGMVVMLKNMDDPSAIGPGMATGMLSLFYAGILAEIVFNPLRHALIDPGEPTQRGVATPRVGTAGIALFAVMSMMACAFILLVSVSELKKEDHWKQIVEEVPRAFDSEAQRLPDASALEIVD